MPDQMSRLLRIAYVGPAVDDGRMDLRDLAPALLGLADTVHRANTLLNGPDFPIQVKVRSDFEHGSFEVNLDLMGLGTVLVGLFSSAPAEALMNLHQTLGMAKSGVASLWSLTRRLRGDAPRTIVDLGNGRVKVDTADGRSVITTQQVVNLYGDETIRQAMRQVIQPLGTDGIEAFRVIGPRGGVIDEVDKDDLPAFEAEVPPPTDRVINVSGSTQVLRILRVPLDDAYTAWSFSDGAHSFTAPIHDEAFLSDVRARVVKFAKGDMLHVEVSTTTTIDAAGILRPRHVVMKVIRVIEPAPHQPLLVE